MQLPGALFKPNLKKQKKSSENFDILGNRNPERIPYISGNRIFLYLLSYTYDIYILYIAQKIKKTHSEKMSYISGNVTFF